MVLYQLGERFSARDGHFPPVVVRRFLNNLAVGWIKGKYENGQVGLVEPAPEPGPVDIEVGFLNSDDRSWDEIIRDPRPRPALSAEADQVLENYRAAKEWPYERNLRGNLRKRRL